MNIVFVIMFLIGLIGSIILRSIKFDIIDVFNGTVEMTQILMNLFMFMLILGFLGFSLIIL